MKGLQQNRSWREISTSWLTSPMLLICIPITAVGMLLAWTAYGEMQASREIQNELRLVAEEGYPTTEAEIESEFMAKTSTEGTLVMNRVEILSSMPLNIGRSPTLPYVAGDVQPLEVLIPGAPWPEEPRVAEFLLHIQPLLNEVEQLENVALPVWMPLEFKHGRRGRLSFAGSYDMNRILRLAFDHAVYRQDSQRALRLLRSATVMTESTDWRLSADSDMFAYLKPAYYTMVNRSLVAEIWSKSELQELHRRLAEPIDLAARWRRMVALGIAGHMGWMDEIQKTESPSEILLNLRSLRHWKTLFDGSFQSVGQRIHKAFVPNDFDLSEEEQTQRKKEGYPYLFIPYTNVFDLFDLELLRRQTLVAIAIKEYQTENGHWPEKLSELDAFGLTADDWAPPGRQEWKYEFDDMEARLNSVVKPKYANRSGTVWISKYTEVIRIR